MVVTGSPGTLPFVRLKLRLIANGLRGRPARVAMFVVGVLLSGFFAICGYAIFAIPGLADDAHAAGILLPLGGAVIVLGWLFLPLVFFGVDESLDPARFALLPLRNRTLIKGLFAAALIGLPAVATLVATAGMVQTTARLGGPVAALGQLVGIVCGLLLCVAVSRSVTSAFATALRSRRSRDLAAIALALLAAAIGPLQLAALASAERANWDTVATVADVIGWTPLGSPYTIGLDIAAGHAWTAPLKLVITLAAIGGLLWWWSTTLENAMLGTAAEGGRRATSTDRTPVDLLLLRRLPQTRFGALVSREVRYWWRETRRRASLITFSMAGLFLPVSLTISSGSPGSMVIFVGGLAALALANQFGFDGSAYAANVTAGVPGRVEINSRATAHAIYTIPLFVVVAVLVGVLSGDPARIPSAFGLLIAAYGVGLGLVLPASVRAAYAFPQSTNPFAMSSGGGPAKGLLAFGVLFGSVVVSLPLQIVALLLGDVWLWIGLPVGIAYGAAAYLIGSGVAADLLDKRMPELLAAVSPQR
ncbi:ABC transporter permease [Actinoplanes sp. NPDC051513]|uniref:ABC transporter permease n=1 Tax=Actinoplanes sp. NPDC051513 TaxID=3363908 RepID=UPI0037B90C24